jgi:hypothetical protein
LTRSNLRGRALVTALPNRVMHFRNAVRLLAWLALIVILVVTVSPHEARPHLALHSANFERALAFAALGCLFGGGYHRRWLLALCLVVLGAFGMEMAQLLVTDRHARIMDAEVKAFAGALGVVIGSIVAEVVGRKYPVLT